MFIGVLVVAAPMRAAAQGPGAAPAIPAQPTSRDAVFGLDKPKHFLLSFFIESGAFASMQAGGAGRTPSLIGASAVTTAFAIGRELHDRRAKGLFSLGDLFWDALGAAAAGAMLVHTYR